MNARDAWLATLGQLQIQLNRSTYDTWLRHAEFLGYEDGRFVVTVPHAYAKDWIERHLLHSMTRTLADIFRKDCEIQVIVWDPQDEEDDQPLLISPDDRLQNDARSRLNPDYCFDHFVIGQANHYATLLAKAIVESPPGKYSPVLFFGGLGTGKTHLLQAIAHCLLERGDTAIYLTAEEFTTELVNAIRSKNNLALRDKFRTADAVIVDDLQFIEGKISTQNEIVAIWDALRNRQRTIIFASDRLPVDMPKLSKDVSSRLQAGPIAALEAPDLALRRDMLDAYSVRRRFSLPATIRDLIASPADSSPRDLAGAIDQLLTYTELTGQTLTDAVARTVLQVRGIAAPQNRLELHDVLETTARYYHVTVEQLASRQRTKLIAQVRQLAMYLAREETAASLPQIGAALGGRDHTTVMHGCAKIAELLASDSDLASDVAKIRKLLCNGQLISE